MDSFGQNFLGAPVFQTDTVLLYQGDDADQVAQILKFASFTETVEALVSNKRLGKFLSTLIELMKYQTLPIIVSENVPHKRICDI